MMLAAGNYHFVAYSCNSTAKLPVPDRNGKVTISPPDDLLYGRARNVTITTDGPNTVAIELSHQFMKVKVNARIKNDAGITISAITASVATNFRGILTLPASGNVLAKGEQIVLGIPFTGWSSYSAANGITSGEQVVYTGADNPFYVRISSLKYSGKEAITTPKTVKFTKALTSGKSYTLRITITNGAPWADSNIYWDANARRLTFAAAGAGTNAQKNYQGVFFKWGSLVGVSVWWGPSSSTDFTSSTEIYVPDAGQASGWRQTSASRMRWLDWLAVPSLAEISVNYSDMRMDYFGTLSTAQTNALYNEKKGDICRYLSNGRYRMPTANELLYGDNAGSGSPNAATVDWGSTSPANRKWTKVSGSNWSSLTSGTNRDGTYSAIPSGAMYWTYARFPASGYRVPPKGAIENVNKWGVYWSSSPYDSQWNTYSLVFRNNEFAYSPITSRHDAFPVRCVLNP
jgi:hypothetical protein